MPVSSFPQPRDYAPSLQETELRGSRPFWHQVAADTFNRRGAQLGAVWIGILIVAAVLAPLLANPQPLLLKSDGQWSSPMLHFLTPTDVILFASAAACIVAFF